MNKKDEALGEVGSEIVVPVVAEQVELTKRVVPGRTIIVRTIPVTEQQTVSQAVKREEVSIERIPVGKVIDEVPGIREEDGLTVVPVVEERISVTKQLLLTEEIHLRRTQIERTEEQKIEVKRTEVEIAEEGNEIGGTSVDGLQGQSRYDSPPKSL